MASQVALAKLPGVAVQRPAEVEQPAQRRAPWARDVVLQHGAAASSHLARDGVELADLVLPEALLHRG